MPQPCRKITKWWTLRRTALIGNPSLFFWHWHGGVLLLKCFWTGGWDGAAPSDQAEALVLLHGLSEAAAQDLFGLVAGHVQQVVAGVRHRQVVLLRRGGLDDDAQALHAMDGDAVAAG